MSWRAKRPARKPPADGAGDLPLGSTQVPLPAPPAAPPRPVSWPSSGKPSSAAPRRRIRWSVVAATFVLLIVVAIGSLGVSRLLNPTIQKDLQLYTVTPRSFPVILE